MTRSPIGRGRHHPIAVMVIVLAALAGLQLAIALAHDLWPLLLIGGAAFLLWRRRRSLPSTRPPKVLPGQVITEAEDLRRQVAKLEADAARHEQLVDDLEDAAGRPIEAVIASYRHIQRQYGPAAVGKPGRRP
jgi:hypothetical protein